MFRLIYNLLFPFVFLAMLPTFAARMVRRGNYRHKFGQRLGLYSPRVRERLAVGAQPVWIHAVSVGEVQVALKLLKAWRNKQPDARFVLSTTTSTGFTLAARDAGERVEVIYNPLDFLPTVAAAVHTIRPSMLVLVEAEVWPNLVTRVKSTGAPVALVNARLSPRSERRYLIFTRIVRSIFSQLDAVCIQDRQDFEVWRQIGPSEEHIHLVGGIKYDSSGGANPGNIGHLRSILSSLGIPPEAPVLLGGSTHPGEEAVLGRTLLALRDDLPNAFLVVAPRHAERSGEVLADLESLGLRVARRSAVGQSRPVSGSPPPDVLLIDTTGELRGWYALATVAFIGKSLLARGGQNPVEAIHAGVPVVCGPHMNNFQALMRSLGRAGAIVTVESERELTESLKSLLANEVQRRHLVAAARAALAEHEGATSRTLEVLLNLRYGGRGD